MRYQLRYYRIIDQQKGLKSGLQESAYPQANSIFFSGSPFGILVGATLHGLTPKPVLPMVMPRGLEPRLSGLKG